MHHTAPTYVPIIFGGRSRVKDPKFSNASRLHARPARLTPRLRTVSKRGAFHYSMGGVNEIRQPYRQRARQWSRMAWAMAFLFASMPAASKLFLGVWGFDGAAEIACLCLMLGTYFHIVGRRGSAAIPDPATMLDQAIQLASSGQTDAAIALLTETIRLSPQLWQAFQYRGELYLRQQSFDAALQDLNEAIRLAPEEPYLYILRAQAHSLLGEKRL